MECLFVFFFSLLCWITICISRCCCFYSFCFNLFWNSNGNEPTEKTTTNTDSMPSRMRTRTHARSHSHNFDKIRLINEIRNQNQLISNRKYTPTCSCSHSSALLTVVGNYLHTQLPKIDWACNNFRDMAVLCFRPLFDFCDWAVLPQQQQQQPLV